LAYFTKKLSMRLAIPGGKSLKAVFLRDAGKDRDGNRRAALKAASLAPR
jgi:hypothetical protein